MQFRSTIGWIAKTESKAAAIAAALLLSAACGTIEHGYRTGEVAGRTLPMNSMAAGERLQMEIEYDAVVGDLIATRGRPKYLHVLDRDHIYFFYLEEDRVAVVVRDGMPPGKLSEQSPIPGHFFRLLPADETRRITAAREAYKAAHPEPRRTQRATSAPASPQPVPDTATLSLTGFDLETLIARFRRPMSAADPGISGWRETALADGGRSGVARAGATEYLIRPDFVSAATSLPRTSRSASNQVRTSYVRVNRAVFGTRAHAITQSVAPLVDQVAADASGRTRIVRRIAGRTVRIVRDTQRDLLVYGVHSD
jgi:hypothetical protein